MIPINPIDQRYIEQLGGYDLDRLSKEPVRLSIERRKIETKIEQSTLDNYTVHVDSYRAIQITSNTCDTMQSDVTTLESTISDVRNLQQPVLMQATKIAKTYQRYRQTLRQHSQLVEILEIPQLMARCVRVHAVEESLELASFVVKMERLHALRQEMKHNTTTNYQDDKTQDQNSIPQIASGLDIIQDIKMDVFRSLHMLYTKLTDKLSSRINLTDSLRVVGYLRRLRHLQTAEDIQTQQNNRTNKDNYDQLDDQDRTDTTLKLNEGKQIHEIFLHCREIFFQREIDRITNTEPYEYLESLTEVYRIYLYDIISQYTSIFDLTETNMKKGTKIKNYLSTIIFSHITYLLIKIENLLPVIEDGSLLSNILEQTMNLGQSLSKVGCDFRPLLISSFENSMFNLFLSTWNNGRSDFHDSMKTIEDGTWSRLANALRSVEDGEEEEHKKKNGNRNGGIDVTYYHRRLLVCRPLAHLTNSILDGFNELRKCASMTIRSRVMDEMLEVLKDVWRVVCATLENMVVGKSGIGIGDDDAAKEALIGLIKIDFCGVLLHCFVSIFGGEKVNGKEISVKSMVEEAGMVEEVGMVVVKEKEVVDVDGDSSKRSE